MCGGFKGNGPEKRPDGLKTTSETRGHILAFVAHIGYRGLVSEEAHLLINQYGEELRESRLLTTTKQQRIFPQCSCVPHTSTGGARGEQKRT